MTQESDRQKTPEEMRAELATLDARTQKTAGHRAPESEPPLPHPRDEVQAALERMGVDAQEGLQRFHDIEGMVSKSTRPFVVPTLEALAKEDRRQRRPLGK